MMQEENNLEKTRYKFLQALYREKKNIYNAVY